MSCNIFLCTLALIGMQPAITLGGSYSRGDFIPERSCAVLFSEANFTGNSFVLNDFDQSVNLGKDYRSSLAGWTNTGSYQVESDCKITFCSDTYFLGTCRVANSNAATFTLGVGVRSANCSCERDCSCDDVHIGKDEHGRAYLNGGCSTCNTQYLRLREPTGSIPSAERNSVTAFVIRTGCNLTTYSAESQRGVENLVVGPVLQGFRGFVASYRFTCDETKFIPRSSSQNRVSLPPMINLPATRAQLYEMLWANGTLSNHPGLLAALTSAENGRSFRNSYVVNIGDQLQFIYGFPQCINTDTGKIGECRIPVNMDHLGISNFELRVITLPIGERPVQDDYRLMASLDEYLSSHEDLQDALPNAVFVTSHYFENDLANDGSNFQRKLQALNALRHHLVDEQYSNVLFLFFRLDILSNFEKRRPGTRIANVENSLIEKWEFPAPIVILPISSDYFNIRKYVNGYHLMENEEYWPKNLESSIGNICEKTGDLLGQSVFKSYFRMKDIPTNSLNSIFTDMQPSNHIKVNRYREISSRAPSEQKAWRTWHSIKSVRNAVDNGDHFPPRSCGTLFSAEDFEGDSFDLMDFDQSINLRKEYRVSLQGWQNTGSVKVERGCKMTLCNDTYFFGHCRTLNSNVSSLELLTSSVSSVNCTCRKDCTCEDVFIPKHEFGRAYLKGGCSICHAEYVRLFEMGNFPNADRDSVDAFVLRKGCSLTVYTEELLRGSSTVITGPVLQDFRGSIGSYRFSCDEKQFIPSQPVLDTGTSGASMVQLPATTKELVELTSANNSSLVEHPGLQAALKSGESGRSAHNAFVLLIGTHQPKLAGFPQCPQSSESLIGECRIPVNVSVLGIKNTELIVVTLPIAVLKKASIQDDYRLMATLDEYISSREDLKSAIPNTVIVYHRAPFKYFATSGPTFQRKLQALHALRGRVLDENYSNVIFLLDNLDWLPDSKERLQEDAITQFESTINGEWAFPAPTVIVPRADATINSHYRNGFRKLGNQQYWPLNLQHSLLNLCEKSVDPLGKEIMKAVFQNGEVHVQNIHTTSFELIPADHSKISDYKEYAFSALAQQPEWKKFHAILSSTSKSTVEVSDFILEKACATLFPSTNFHGDSIYLHDFDQIAIFGRDFRVSLKGWNTTSVRVESGCKLTLCNGTYFTGTCQHLISDASSLDQHITAVHSANCTCDRKCNCENIFIPKHEYGRAYLTGGCSTCDAEYVRLGKVGKLTNKANSVEALTIRTGCNLTLYPESDFSGQEKIVTGPIIHLNEFPGIVASYRFSCEDSQFVPQEPTGNKSLPTLIDLPIKFDELRTMRSAKHNMSQHPGIKAAQMSAENERSFKNAYVILIGVNWAKFARFPQCKEGSWSKISECRIPLNVDKLGITTTELIVVTVPIACCPGSTLDGDYRLMASLDEYLSLRESLKDVIPNAVIVYHRISNNGLVIAGHTFQRKLQALHALRGRLLDENNSNVIFILDNLQSLPNVQENYVDERVAHFEEDIKGKWAFPSPLVVIPRNDPNADSRYVNGYRKLFNGEYWPKNLETAYLSLCEKGGDPLGKAIFESLFEDNDVQPESINQLTFDLPLSNHIKSIQYKDMATSALSQQPIWRNFHLALSRATKKVQGLLKESLGAEWAEEIEKLKVELEKEKAARLEDGEKLKNEIWEKLKEDLVKLFH